MLLDLSNTTVTDWTLATQCRDCKTLPQVKCNLKYISLTCPVCRRGSATHIKHGIMQAIEDWNRYHTEYWYK